MAIFRLELDNTNKSNKKSKIIAYLVKAIPSLLEDKFIEINSSSKIKFIKVDKFPQCKFETYMYNPDKQEIEIDKERFIQQATSYYISKLKMLEFKRVTEFLQKYGYKDLGDLQINYKFNSKDKEIKFLLNWYYKYDDLIWEEIENLQQISTQIHQNSIKFQKELNQIYEKLVNYSPVAVEQNLFNKSVLYAESLLAKSKSKSKFKLKDKNKI